MKNKGTYLRATFVALLALLATLRASIGDGLDPAEWVDLITNTAVAFGAYLGIGALPTGIEPTYGKTLSGE